MRYLLALYVAILCCAMACSAPVTRVGDIVPGATAPASPVFTFHADTSFLPDERADLSRAAAIWFKQTGGVARITVDYDLDYDDVSGLQRHVSEGHHLLVRAESWMDMVVSYEEEDNCKGCILGWMTDGGIHNPFHAPVRGVFIADRLGDLRVQVMLHEFGHALGLPHLYQVQSIMYPAAVPGKVACLRKVDLDEFCHVNECGQAKTIPCE